MVHSPKPNNIESIYIIIVPSTQTFIWINIDHIDSFFPFLLDPKPSCSYSSIPTLASYGLVVTNIIYKRTQIDILMIIEIQTNSQRTKKTNLVSSPLYINISIENTCYSLSLFTHARTHTYI